MNELAFLFRQVLFTQSPIFFYLFLFCVFEKILNFACDPDLDSSPTVTEIYMRIFPGVCY